MRGQPKPMQPITSAADICWRCRRRMEWNTDGRGGIVGKCDRCEREIHQLAQRAEMWEKRARQLQADIKRRAAERKEQVEQRAAARATRVKTQKVVALQPCQTCPTNLTCQERVKPPRKRCKPCAREHYLLAQREFARLRTLEQQQARREAPAAA